MTRDRRPEARSGPAPGPLIALFAAAALVLNFPLLLLWDRPATVLGLPVLAVALFAIWAAVIVALALLSRPPGGGGRR